MTARPDLPTLREAGVADYDLTGWWATYFPAKTPPAIVAAMREIIQKAAKTPHMAEMFTTFALEPLLASGEELAALQRTDSEKWGKLVRAANLRPE
jgi:tripartite-type tricarboxylate transporter receptor subunit TctC